MIDKLGMKHLTLIILLLLLVIFNGACTVQYPDTYGVVSFKIKNVD